MPAASAVETATTSGTTSRFGGVSAPGPGDVLTTIHLASMIAFLAFTVVAMSVHLVGAESVDDEILASSVGVYLVAGFLFAAVYQLLWVTRGPCIAGAISPEGLPALSTFVYFSLMTQTTVGFGDLTPIGAVARNVTVVQAVLGQMYLVVLMARLVGLHARGRSTPPSSSSIKGG